MLLPEFLIYSQIRRLGILTGLLDDDGRVNTRAGGELHVVFSTTSAFLAEEGILVGEESWAVRKTRGGKEGFGCLRGCAHSGGVVEDQIPCGEETVYGLVVPETKVFAVDIGLVVWNPVRASAQEGPA